MDLEAARKDREPLDTPGLPVSHRSIPACEQPQFAIVTRQMLIDIIRYWITNLRLRVLDLFRPVPPSVEKHCRTVFLFPAPRLQEARAFPPSDAFFAEQRFCGPQTATICRLELLPQWASLTEPIVEALADKRVFLVQYPDMAKYQRKEGAYLPSVAGVFSYARTAPRYRVECLKIDDQIVDPSTSPGRWAFAKACFQACDMLYYIMARACGSFLFLEPIVLYFYRCVPPTHALFPLLDPLFSGHAVSCHFVRQMLLEPNGVLSMLLPLTEKGIKDFISHAYERWSFENADLNAKLKNRNMEDVEGYAYAEDGKELYKVAQGLAYATVLSSYSADTDVQLDMDLR